MGITRSFWPRIRSEGRLSLPEDVGDVQLPRYSRSFDCVTRKCASHFAQDDKSVAVLGRAME
jgi:hypothetical protein